MVFVKLSKDVAEGGKDYQVAVQAARDVGLRENDPNFPRIKTSSKRTGNEIKITEYKKGVVVSMDEASADKWIQRGLCEIVEQ